MKLGLHIPATTWAGGASRLGPTLVAVVEAAEAAGFDTIDVADHLWQHPNMGGPEASQIEAYTTLGFIAARTRPPGACACWRSPRPSRTATPGCWSRW